jgi:hypothetical protein
VKRVMPLVLAIAAFAAVTVLWIVSDRRAPQRVYDDYSSANTSGNGLSLAAGYLNKQRRVAMLTRPLARATLERNAVVFRVVDEVPTFFDPEDLEEHQYGPPKPRREPLLNDAEEAFVRRGGRLILASSSGALVTLPAGEKIARKVFPIWPNAGDLELSDAWSAFIQLRPRMHALFASGTRAVVARERIGEGELIVISAPQLLQNEALARGNHLQLLAALAGSGRPVYFDEVPHGIVSGDGALALMKDWNLGPFLLLLAAVTILIFWRGGRRIGPAVDHYRETRSEAIDLVRSLAALYREVTTDAEALALYYESLTRTVAMQSGLRGDALRRRVDDLTRGRRDLHSLNNAFASAFASLKSQRRRT